jgi:hypothetical protein
MIGKESKEQFSTTTSPSEGEKGSMVGYHGQYMVAAELIYKALLEDKLESIRITTEEGGGD